MGRLSKKKESSRTAPLRAAPEPKPAAVVRPPPQPGSSSAAALTSPQRCDDLPLACSEPRKSSPDFAPRSGAGVGLTAGRILDAELQALSTPRLMAAAERELASDTRRTLPLPSSADDDETDRLIAEEMQTVSEGATAPAARHGLRSLDVAPPPPQMSRGGFDAAAYQRPAPMDLAAANDGRPPDVWRQRPPQQQFEEQLTLDDNDEALIAEIAGEA